MHYISSFSQTDWSSLQDLRSNPDSVWTRIVPITGTPGPRINEFLVCHLTFHWYTIQGCKQMELKGIIKVVLLASQRKEPALCCLMFYLNTKTVASAGVFLLKPCWRCQLCILDRAQVATKIGVSNCSLLNLLNKFRGSGEGRVFCFFCSHPIGGWYPGPGIVMWSCAHIDP